MDELDQRLEELVLEAQKHPPDSPRRRKIIGELWDTMLPHLRRRPPKPTDAEARRRLAGVKKSCRARYGAKIDSDFEQDWADVLQDVQVEVSTKTIDIYKKGVDYQLSVDYQLFQEWEEFREKWKEFCEKLSPQQNPEVYAEFLLEVKDVEKFCSQFLEKRTKGKRNYPQKKAERLTQACQKFCQGVQSIRSEADLQLAWNDFAYAELCQQVEKFRIRFLQRRTRGKRSYPLEKAERLAQACQNFCQRVQSSSSEADLQLAWDDFCQKLQQLYQDRKFWYLFTLYVKMRCIDKIRERLKLIRERLKLIREEQQALREKQQPPPPKIPRKVAKIIYQDPDEIFRRKHVPSYPKANYREIALLKFQGYTLKDINAHFDNEVNAQTTIAPFYSRACKYFQPIIDEYLATKDALDQTVIIALPQAVIDEIIEDADGKYSRKQMESNPSINFQGIIQARLGGVPSWKILAQQLNVTVWELIYFYLDCIKSFKLIPMPKRHRSPKKKGDND